MSEALVERAAARVNIACRLTSMAKDYPDKRAVVVACGDGRYSSLTFSELERETDRHAHGLERCGVRRAMRTVLMVRPGLEFFALTFALFKLGAVPVLIDPGMGRRNLLRCLAGVEAEAFIGIPLAHTLRTVCRSAFKSVSIAVTVGRRWFWGGHRLCDVRDASAERYETVATGADDPAAILFTSGSTGPAKGVVYTHGVFDAQVNYLESHYGFSPEEIDLATFPLFALFDAALGVTAVIPEMDASRPGSADPRKLVQAIREQGCTQMFGSPALIRRLAQHGARTGAKLDSIKRVLMAGAPIPPRLIASMMQILPADAEIHTPYGATESLPVSDMRGSEILTETAQRTDAGGGTCVGRPLDGMDVRVIEISDEPIERWSGATELRVGAIGEIVVQGPVVTSEYFRKPDATRLAKIRDDDGAIRHRMGDVGYFDEQGRLWFCGRKAHRVVTQRGTLFSVQCEAVFNRHPLVFRTALVGIGERGRQRPVVCVELEHGIHRADRKKLTRELLSLGAERPHTREINTILFARSFPVDVRHNAKIFREKLAVWAAKRLA